MMSTITEIAPDVYRISIYNAQSNMQFNHFIVRDEQPVLYHTGSRSMFPMVKQAVAKLIRPEQLRWIGFSHFEADECGALNEWLSIAPSAQAVGTVTAVRVNLSGFADRAARALPPVELLETGKYRFRMIATPHLPHGWDAGMFFEEIHSILFCSDLFHQLGDVEPVTGHSLIERARQVLLANQVGPLKDYQPFTSKTGDYMRELAELNPKILATQHGSTYTGDGAQALLDLLQVIKEVYENH